MGSRGELRGTVVRDLEQVFGQGTGTGLTEGQLLRRFVMGRDEAAFSTLVSRHGPMVMGVCRRVLAAAADTDDAFQATFVVLIRRAAALEDVDCLGPWLYGVAWRVASRARRECEATARGRESGDRQAGIGRARPAGRSERARCGARRGDQQAAGKVSPADRALLHGRAQSGRRRATLALEGRCAPRPARSRTKPAPRPAGSTRLRTRGSTGRHRTAGTTYQGRLARDALEPDLRGGDPRPDSRQGGRGCCRFGRRKAGRCGHSQRSPALGLPSPPFWLSPAPWHSPR